MVLFHCTQQPVVSGPYVPVTGAAFIKASVVHDEVFPFVADSAVVTVSALDMQTISQNISVSGDSVKGRVTQFPLGNNRIITVIVYNAARNRWCMGKDTCDFLDTFTKGVAIKLKQVQPNVVSNDLIPGHQLKSDEIWNGTCFLRGDIIIPEGMTLNIMPGATIKISPGQPDWDSGWNAKNKIEIFCYKGTLIAQGSSDNIITFALDSAAPRVGSWWGIGLNYGSCTIAYSYISSASYGVFIFTSQGVISCDHCMFSYCNVGFADFGPNTEYTTLTFASVTYPFFIYGKNKVVDISLCEFPSASSIDVYAVDSNQRITVRSCNFASASFYNLYIPDPQGTVIFADNCYNIFKVNDPAAILLNNPAQASIPDAGCGFSMHPTAGAAGLKKMRIAPAQQVALTRETMDNALHLTCAHKNLARQP